MEQHGSNLIVGYRERLAKGHEEAAIDLLTVSPVLANVELDERLPSLRGDIAGARLVRRSDVAPKVAYRCLADAAAAENQGGGADGP